VTAERAAEAAAEASASADATSERMDRMFKDDMQK
jgi:hypothetical protein